MTQTFDLDRADIAGLVLAAGESSRMGRDKALLTYRGRTFLETIGLKLQEAGLHRIVVVLGHHAEAIQQAVHLPTVEFVINRNYRRGQTSSLQQGITALETGKDRIEAMALCLVDHPAFDAATISALVAEFKRSALPVVIPSYRGRRGHPVLIARAVFAPLLALRPDEGANTVIRALANRIQTLEVPDPGILVDVDFPESYHLLEQHA